MEQFTRYRSTHRSLPLTTKILRNTSWTIISRLGHILINLILIPFIISHVGTVRYGIWVALFAFVDYINLLDFGTGAATIKYVADNYTKGKFKSIGQIVSLSIFFNCIFVPVLIVVYCFTDQVVSFFHIAPDDLAEAEFIFHGILANFAIGQFAGVFRSTLIGIQHIHIVNLNQIAYLILYSSGVFIILTSGHGLSEVIVWMFVIRIVLVAFQVSYLLVFLRPALKGLFDFDLMKSKEFFYYGSKLQFASLSGFLNLQIDKILIGHYLKIEFVAFYELGAKLAMMVRHIPSVMMGPLIPAAAQLAASRDVKRLRELYLQANYYFIMIAAPISAFLYTNSKSIIELWLGSLYNPLCNTALKALSIAFFFQMLCGVVTSIGRGAGNIKYELESSVLNATLNITLSIILVIKMGFFGTLLGTAIAMAVSHTLFYFRFSRHMQIGMCHMFRKTLVKPLICSFAAALACYLVNSLLLENLYHLNALRLAALSKIVFLGATFTLVYLGGLLLSRAVGRREWQLFGKALSAIRNFS